jgi:hypothetical protein
MKISVLAAAAHVAGLAQDTAAWAPSVVTSLATRKVGSSSRDYYNTNLYVSGNVEEPKSKEEDKTLSAFDEDSSANILGHPIPYSELTIGVLKETFPGENRVSQTPDSIRTLIKEGFTVIVQSGGKRKLHELSQSFA